MGLQPTASRTSPLIECSYAFDPEFSFDRESANEPMRYGSAFHELIAWLLSDLIKKEAGKKTTSGLTKVPSFPDKLVEKTVKKFRLPPSSVGPLPGHVRSSFQCLAKWLRGSNEWGSNFLAFAPQAGGEMAYVETSFGFDPVRSKTRAIANPSEDEHVYEELEKGEIGMTADLSLPGLELDHKTGSNGDFSEPGENLQMRTLGAAGWARGGKRRVPVLAVLHADRMGLPKVYADEPSQADITKHVSLLSKAVARIGDGSLRPGPWCNRCPARDACPAQHSQLVSRVSELIATGGIGEFLAGDDRSRDLLPGEEIGRLHMLRQKFDALSKIAQKEMTRWVKEHGDDTAIRPDQKSLVIIEKTTERISKSSILEVLGPIKGAKELERLRSLGVLREETHEELRAVDD